MLTDNLTHYWKLDELSGDATDSVGGTTLTNTGAMTYAAAKINNGALTAASQYLTATDPSFSEGANMSWSFWAFPSSTPTDFIVLNKRLATGNQRSFLIRNDGVSSGFQVQISDNGASEGIATTASGVWTTDGFHMYTVTFDGSQALGSRTLLYKDGTLVSWVSEATPATVFDSTANFFVGAANGGTQNFLGLLDEIGTWNKTLTQTEVTQLYNSGAGLSYPYAAPFEVRNDSINDVPDIQTFTSPGVGTWTKPNGVKTIFVVCVGGGGGGGGGAQAASGANYRIGGTGGGGAAYTRRTFSASDLGATEALSVAAGGASGAGAIAGAANDGSPGGDGGNSTFGTVVRLTGYGGGGGGQGVRASGVGAGSGGGTGSKGGTGLLFPSLVAGGFPGTGTDLLARAGSGGYNDQAAAPIANQGCAEYGGAAGAYAADGCSSIYGAGGGGYGGYFIADGTGFPGSNGGISNSYVSGGGGAVGANGASGSAGTAGASGSSALCGSGGGGGGAGTAGAGGTGGDGGAVGGGGGGGGAGTGAAGGAGGAGGRGQIWVYSF